MKQQLAKLEAMATQWLEQQKRINQGKTINTNPENFAPSIQNEENPYTLTTRLQLPSSGKQKLINSYEKNPHCPKAFYADSQKPYQKDVFLQELKLISISQLSTFMVHKGCYLKVQFVRDTMKKVAIQGRVKDHKGSEVDISIYNFDTKGKSCNQIFRKGTVIFVKEPFFKIALAGNQNVRIDNPADIEFEGNAKIPETERYRQEGIELMKNKKYLEAYLHYDSAIAKIADEKVINTFILNKAIVSYHLNLLHDYYDNARSVLQFQPANIKALYHTFKALVLLGKQKKANQLLKQKGQYFQNDTQRQMKSFLEKVAKTRDNKIDWYSVFKTETIIGEYFSNQISIQQTKNGYGIIAKKTIPPGEVLIIENPFLYSQRENKNENLTILNEHSNIMESHCNRMYGISKNFRNKLNNFIDHKELSMNEGAEVQEGTKDLSNRCPQTLAKAINKNSFALSQFCYYINSKKQSLDSRVGLFEKISMINHSCEENVDRFCLGNTMIIFTIREIPEGKEVLTNFTKSWDYDERKKQLKYWGIQCNCNLCKAQLYEKLQKQPYPGDDSWELKRKNLKLQLQNKNKRDLSKFKQFSEYYDFFAMGIIVNLGDILLASKMFRRVFPMTEKQSLEILKNCLPK